MKREATHGQGARGAPREALPGGDVAVLVSAEQGVMRRLACVHIPALALQLLLRGAPHWRRAPAAVIDVDRPQGVVLWVNERARRAGVLPGMRYAAGLSLCRELCAGVVAPDAIAREGERLTHRLRRFSPEVELSAAEPGVFWVGASGLSGLHPDLRRWGQELRLALRDEGFESAVVVGFRRFATYAVVTCTRDVQVFDAPEEELRQAWRVPLARLHVEPAFRDVLARLAVHTVGDLVGLPERGLRDRFGARAAALHRWASGDAGVPVQPEHEVAAASVRRELLQPVSDTTQLLFSVKGALSELLAILAVRGEVLTELRLELILDHAAACRVSLRPATATLDEMQLIDLVRLKLETLELAAGVEELCVSAEGAAASSEQLRLFTERPRRDLAAANRALARVRADLGDDAVVVARLCDGHLPEACYTWEPVAQLTAPHPRGVDAPVMIRRVLARPELISRSSRPTHDDGWLLARPRLGSVVRSAGPFIVSGGWWNKELHRSYHFVETQRGDLLWVYLDRRRRAWFLQGMVE